MKGQELDSLDSRHILNLWSQMNPYLDESAGRERSEGQM